MAFHLLSNQEPDWLQDVTSGSWGLQQFTLTQPNSINILWLVPQESSPWRHWFLWKIFEKLKRETKAKVVINDFNLHRCFLIG